MDGSLQFQLAVLDEFLDLLGQLALDAVAHLDHLLDLVATDFLHGAFVQKTHIHTAFGHLVAQDVFHLLQLEFGIAQQGDFLVLELDCGAGALEIETRTNFFGTIFHGVFHFHHVGLTHGIKRRHNPLPQTIDRCDNYRP